MEATWIVGLSIVGILLFLSWGVLLWRLATSKKDRTGWFYTILAIPFIGGLISVIANTSFNMIGVFGLIVSLLLLGMWAMAVYSAGGKKQMAWFWVLLLIQPLFIIYWLVEGF